MADLEARGVRFHVARLGRGPRAVMFLHGFVFDNLASWYLAAGDLLADRCDMLFCDLRGHGLSDRPPSGYTIDDLVLDLHALRTAAGLAERELDIVGHSGGGHIALRYAQRYPSGVRSLVLVDGEIRRPRFAEPLLPALGLPDSEREETLLQMLEEWVELHRVGGSVSKDGAYLKDLVSQRAVKRRAQMRSTAEALVLGTTFVEDASMAVPITDVELEEIDLPVALVVGERSDLYEEITTAAELMPRAHLEVIPEVEHFVLIHGRDALRAILDDWFSTGQHP